MLSPHIYAAFAHERHQTFLAQAETDRRNRQAQLIRPVRRADAPLLADGFARLSARFRRLRLGYFTDVDHHNHEALVAVDPRTGDGVVRVLLINDSPNGAATATVTPPGTLTAGGGLG